MVHLCSLFLFVMQACLETLEKTMPEDSKLQFQTDTRTGERGGKVSGTDWPNQGEFTFSFWASLYADDAATPLASRAALLPATNAIYDHLRKFGLLMHVGSDGKRSKTEAMYCPARNEDYGDGDTSDLVLDCGGTVSFTEKFVYLGSLLHRDLTDKHGVDARIKKAPQAFGALRDKTSALQAYPNGSKGNYMRAACSRSCCMAASRGASRRLPSVGSAAGTTSGFARCAVSPCARLTSTASPPRASSNARAYSNSSTTLRAARCSG